MRPDGPTLAVLPTILYRIYAGSPEGELLYVGITKNLAYRVWQHERDAPWWPESPHIEHERFPNRPSAEDAEMAAIQCESPTHNRYRNRRQEYGQTYPLRLPPELHAQVKRFAEREHRTINNLLIHIVSEWVARQEHK